MDQDDKITDDEYLRAGILHLLSTSSAFEFLKHDEDLYTLEDAEEIYQDLKK